MVGILEWMLGIISLRCFSHLYLWFKNLENSCIESYPMYLFWFYFTTNCFWILRSQFYYTTMSNFVNIPNFYGLFSIWSFILKINNHFLLFLLMEYVIISPCLMKKINRGIMAILKIVWQSYLLLLQLIE